MVVLFWVLVERREDLLGVSVLYFYVGVGVTSNTRAFGRGGQTERKEGPSRFAGQAGLARLARKPGRGHSEASEPHCTRACTRARHPEWLLVPPKAKTEQPGEMPSGVAPLTTDRCVTDPVFMLREPNGHADSTFLEWVATQTSFHAYLPRLAARHDPDPTCRQSPAPR